MFSQGKAPRLLPFTRLMPPSSVSSLAGPLCHTDGAGRVVTEQDIHYAHRYADRMQPDAQFWLRRNQGRNHGQTQYSGYCLWVLRVYPPF